MGQESTHPTSKAAARRQLSIVYFIDSARTRSTSISMTKIYVIGFVFLLIIVWSLGSIYLLVSLSTDHQELKQNLQSAKRTLFEYQVMHERVFEDSYPSSPPLTMRSLAATDFKTSEHVLVPLKHWRTEPNPSPLPWDLWSDTESVATNATVEKTQLVASKDAAPQKLTAAESGEFRAPQTTLESIRLHNHHLSQDSGLIQLSVDISNDSQAVKVEGYIWGVVEYTTNSGKKLLLSSPNNISIDTQTKVPATIKEASTFGIKRFKRKTFSFKVPFKEPGEITSVAVGLADKSGKTTRIVPLSTEASPSPAGS